MSRKERHRMPEDKDKQPAPDADTPVNRRAQGPELPSIPEMYVGKPGEPLERVHVGLYSKPGAEQLHNQKTVPTSIVGETSQNHPTRELPPGAPLSSLAETRQGVVVNPDLASKPAEEQPETPATSIVPQPPDTRMLNARPSVSPPEEPPVE